MDINLEKYVERVMDEQKITNGIKFFSWITLFKR